MKRLLLVAALVFAFTGQADARMLEAENTFAKAIISASTEVWPPCGFPPDRPAFEFDHDAAVRIARCLNRLGYLSDSALTSYELDDTFLISGRWDGAPLESTARWAYGGRSVAPGSIASDASLTPLTPLEGSASLDRPWPMLVLVAVAVGAVVLTVLWRRTRRG